MANETTVFLVRHCQDYPNDNLLPLEAARVTLTPFGFQQARAVARFLKSRAISVTYTSVFERSKQTARVIQEETNARVVVDERLNEQVLSQSRIDKQKAKEIKRQLLTNLDSEPEGGQSLRAAIDLFVDAITEYASQSEKNVCVVSHGFLMQAALQRMCKLDYAPQLGEGSVTILAFRKGEPRLIATNIRPFVFLRLRARVEQVRISIVEWFK